MMCVYVCVCVEEEPEGGSWGAMCIIQGWIDIWRKIAAGLINLNVFPWGTAPCVCMCVCLSGEVSSRHQQHFSPVSSDLASLCTTRLMNRSVRCVPMCVCVYTCVRYGRLDAICILFSQRLWDIVWVHLVCWTLQRVTWQQPSACLGNCAVSGASLCSRCSTQHAALKVEQRGQADLWCFCTMRTNVNNTWAETDYGTHTGRVGRTA